MSAIKKAWAAEVDGVEIDLRMTADQIIILYHDRRIERQEISSVTFNELKKIDDEIPSLKSVLNKIPAPGFYLFDLKEDSQKFLKVLSNTIIDSGFPEAKLLFQSDNAQFLVALRKRHPKAKYVYLSRLSRTFPFFNAPRPEKIIEDISAYQFDAISIKGRGFIDEQFIKILRTNERSVYIWTINQVERAKYYSNLGVTGVITDNTVDVKQALTQP